MLEVMTMRDSKGKPTIRDSKGRPRKKRHSDINQLAHLLGELSTEQQSRAATEPTSAEISRVMAALGRKGAKIDRRTETRKSSVMTKPKLWFQLYQLSSDGEYAYDEAFYVTAEDANRRADRRTETRSPSEIRTGLRFAAKPLSPQPRPPKKVHQPTKPGPRR
jgi:hypothetical protein